MLLLHSLNHDCLAANNRIAKIEDLDSQTALEELNLERNRLSTLSNLHALGSLRVLKLRGNSLTKMDGIEELYSLEYLDSAFLFRPFDNLC